MTDDTAPSPAVLRALAVARGLARAHDLFPETLAFAAGRAAKPLAAPDRASTTEPALQFDPARYEPAP